MDEGTLIVAEELFSSGAPGFLEYLDTLRYGKGLPEFAARWQLRQKLDVKLRALLASGK